MKSACFRTLLSLALLSMLTAHKANAEPDLSYTYAGVQYMNQRLDEFDCRQDGLVLNGSLAIDRDWFARAAFADVSGNRGCGSRSTSVGGGYRMAFNEIFDMYGVLSLESISPRHGSSGSGLVALGGMRGFIADQLEGKVELAHHTVFSGETTITGGLAYWFDRQFSATGDLTLASNGATFALGVRMHF